jgi:hypothetical protein
VTLAGQIMQSEFERMRLVDWKDISDAVKYPASKDITADAKASFGSASAIASTFTITRAVVDVPGRIDMKQITVTTTWKSYDGRSLSRSYATYYGRNGLYDYFYNSY